MIYLLMVPVGALLTILGLILAPIFPLFSQDKDGWLDNHSIWGIGPRLPSWLNVFMTPDNSLNGDATFERINGRSYWSKVKWLWRNPAYSFGLRHLISPYITFVRGDKTIRDNDNAKAGWCYVKANGLFQFTYIISIGFNRCVMGNFGWNIRALVDDNVQPKPNPYQATFAFTPFRLSGYR